ncbi:MAG: hypothetical protein HGGPFJEG_01061 [Ignavibacteria bacterium]|nr:hypothetical protein [Ignavibacteria bacterium]
MIKKIFKYVVFELIRSRIVWAYAVFLLLSTLGLFYLGQNSSKTVISILNIILFIIPLVSIIFGTIHLYNSKEFIEFLLTQPVDRKTVYWSEYFGLACVFSFVFTICTGIPVLIFNFSFTSIYLITSGIILTFVFISLAFLSSVINNDKVKGIGLSIILWLYFAIIFDGLIMSVFYLFRDYPLEKIIIFLTSLNPVDLSRVMVILQTDVSAMMGFSGATIQNYMGSFTGKVYAFAILILWILIPSYISYKIFSRKNF